jgi:osmotically-inducible protein OsmY
MTFRFILPAIFVAALATSGCVPVVVGGAGATVGMAAAQEGGIKTAYTDKAIYVKISDQWAMHSFEMYRKLTLKVKEGRVLIAGSVPNPDTRVEAVRLAWQVEGVKQVINEITVDQGEGVSGYMRDAWLTGNVKAQLLLDKNIQSINYNVDTVNGTVYLMGIAQDQAELGRALNAVRTTRFVKNVVSYVRLRGETPAGTLEPTGGTRAVNDNAGGATYNSNAPAPDNSYSGSGYKGGAVQSEPIGKVNF